MKNPIKDETDFLNYAALHADLEGTVLLYSGGNSRHAIRSFLCLDPLEIVTVGNDTWEKKNTRDGSLDKGTHSDPWHILKDQLIPSKSSFDGPEWVGYLSYEMGAFSDPNYPLPFHPPELPLAKFFKAGTVIVFEHGSKQSHLYSTVSHKLPKEIKKITSPLLEKNLGAKEIFRMNRENYSSQIIEIQREISLGNVYQVNLSHEVHWETNASPFPLYLSLIKGNSTPFSAYLKGGDFALISASPERLLKKKGSLLEARPIKGTIRRGKTGQEDARMARQLKESIKDRAEHLMIVDLIRNDLSKISIAGTVIVNPFMELEKYSSVFHLVSTLQGKALPERGAIELLQNMFPGGSITGCPKLSAMEKIYKYETRPRGIYTGSIGYLTPEENFDFNIAIRTLAHQKNKVTCGLGGGIIMDSNPFAEYEETLHKGAPIFKLLSQEKNN